MKEAEIYPSDDVRVVSQKRVFSLEHANKTLPLVGRIVHDVVGVYRQMAATQQRLASEPLDIFERETLEISAEKQETDFEGLVDELTAVGCELKDANIGLVDFVGHHDGRDVYLCWHLGEDRIEHWHELHSGFSARRPVTSLKENA